MRRGQAKRQRGVRRLARDEGGATAVEFALVALPFLFMLFAVLELGVLFIVDSALDTAVIQTGRLVRTGQAQQMTQAQFKENVCQRMSIFAGDCPTRLKVDVRVLDRFAGATPPEPAETDADLAFDTGARSQIVLVTAWYRHPLISPVLTQGLSRMKDGTALLTATSAFRNEPF